MVKNIQNKEEIKIEIGLEYSVEEAIYNIEKLENVLTNKDERLKYINKGIKICNDNYLSKQEQPPEMIDGTEGIL